MISHSVCNVVVRENYPGGAAIKVREISIYPSALKLPIKRSRNNVKDDVHKSCRIFSEDVWDNERANSSRFDSQNVRQF